MNKPLIAIFLLSLLTPTLNMAASEPPMDSTERAAMQAAQRKAAEREAFYKRLNLVLGESTLPDDDFISKMVRDNHRWSAEQLKQCTQNNEALSDELMRLKKALQDSTIELEGIKKILLDRKP